MAFLRKHLVLAASFLLVVACLSLYFFLVRPVMVRRQRVAETMEEKLAQLRRYRDDPPSPEMIDRLSRKKEMLEGQYEEIVKTLNFVERVPLPEDPGDPLFLDEQIERFERRIERAEDELGRLAERAGIIIPERLGFGEERPENLEELSMLLSQLLLLRELVTLIIETEASDLFLLNPLPPGEEIVVFPRERREMPPGMQPRREMGMPPGMQEMRGMPPGMDPMRDPRRDPRRERPPEIEPLPERKIPLGRELRFELGVRAEISALTNLLYRIANHSYFFAVQDLEIRAVRVRREAPPRIDPRMEPRMEPRRDLRMEPRRDPRMEPRRDPRRERRRPPTEWEMRGMQPRRERRRPPRRELPPRERELPLRAEPEEVEGELEVRFLVAARLSPPDIVK